MNKVDKPARLTVLFWGTYDLSKPRTRILREGLRETGVKVIEIHSDVWSQFADKSQMSKIAMAVTLLKVLMSYPRLVFRYIRAPEHDVVFVPYLGQFDVLCIWFFARLRGKPIVWDMFLSLYDTLVNDRRMLPGWAPPSLLLWVIESLGCRAASRVLLDTKTHAAYISEVFSLPFERADAVPVGAETSVFDRQNPCQLHAGPTKVLFYGQLTPLHGIETILDAALSERGRAHVWRIIGKGQQSKFVESKLDGADAGHIVRENWVEYDSLISAIAQTDICLGIFGSSRKAASVVPNKVYQCLAAGRTVVTRQSPAIDEIFSTKTAGLILVPDADPDALLDAIEAARSVQFPVMPEGIITTVQPREIGRLLCERVFVPMTHKTEKEDESQHDR